MEYEGLKVMALHARAVAEGVESAQLEDAMEGERPKAALIALLLAKHTAGTSAIVARRRAELQAKRREELEALKVLELHKRAVGCEGIGTAEVEEAMEADKPRLALVALLLERAA